MSVQLGILTEFLTQKHPLMGAKPLLSLLLIPQPSKGGSLGTQKKSRVLVRLGKERQSTPSAQGRPYLWTATVPKGPKGVPG